MSDQNHILLALTAQIVAAHAGNNKVEIDALPNMIRSTYNTLSEFKSSLPMLPADGEAPHTDHPGHDHQPAQDIHVHPTYGQTVFSDHLICMEDGLSMKMLKRHLITVHGMTPDEYRAKWGLPDSYPMVAAEYATLRSSLALQSGLGLKPEDRPSKGRKGRRDGRTAAAAKPQP